MQASLLALGLVSLAIVWLGPLPDLARSSFSAHMTMHMTVVAIAAPLIAFGVRGTPLDPALRRPHWFPALQASMVDLFVVWGWHLPALHNAARTSTVGLGLEQTTFLLAALWLWIAAVGGATAQSSSRRGAGVFALLFTFMHMTLLGALLALAPRVLYGDHGGHANGASLADQQWGGAAMVLGGSVAYLAGALTLTVGLLRPEAHQRASKRALS